VIIGSIALVVVSAALWFLGLRESSDLWYYASIVSSVLAAFALIVGARQRARARIPDDDFDVDPLHRTPGVVVVGIAPGVRAPTRRPAGQAAVHTPTADAGLPVTPARAGEEPVPDPPDEPPPQLITDLQAGRIAEMTAVVLVVDGRPRYHLTGCPHLLGRSPEQIAVNEAVRYGFTPCGHCEPALPLLAQR
jgi:hypothetical protein